MPTIRTVSYTHLDVYKRQVKNTANEEAAKNFVEFLKTDEAMKVFESYGFTKGE